MFVHNYLFIVGLTGIGRATEEALGFNDARLRGPLGTRHDAILVGTRHDAILVGRYPPRWARPLLVSAEES